LRNTFTFKVVFLAFAPDEKIFFRLAGLLLRLANVGRLRRAAGAG